MLNEQIRLAINEAQIESQKQGFDHQIYDASDDEANLKNSWKMVSQNQEEEKQGMRSSRVVMSPEQIALLDSQ